MSTLMPSDLEPPSCKSSCTVFLDEPICCIAYIPAQPGYFLVGTYSLQEVDEKNAGSVQSNNGEASNGPSQARSGSLVLCKVDNLGKEIEVVQTMRTKYAIFDLQFVRHSIKFVVAMSDGTLGFGACCRAPSNQSTGAASDVSLTPLHLVTKFPRSTMITSCKWIDRGNWLAASTSTGDIYIMQLVGDHLMNHGSQDPSDTDRAFRLVTTWVGKHDLEAWCVEHVTASAGDGLWSGGDDAILGYHPLPMNVPDGDAETSLRFRRLHGAGITALCTINDHVLITGSYDDMLRVLVFPPHSGILGTKTPICSEFNMGGGVWKIKKLYKQEDNKAGSFRVRLLVCCMYAGVKIVDLINEPLQGGNWRVKILATFTEHESMAYAAEPVLFHTHPVVIAPIVSGSFYDKRLCLWNIPGYEPRSFDV